MVRIFGSKAPGGYIGGYKSARSYKRSGNRSEAIRIREWSADGRIRTGDPLFTKQAAIEFSSDFSLSMYS